MLKRASLYTLVVLLLVGVMTANAGLSFVGGARVGFGSVVGTVTIVGFGNKTDQVSVTMNVSGSNLAAWCQNKGGNLAPGQNPVSVVANVTSGSVKPDKNGNATVTMSVNILPSGGQAGCPNKNWQVVDVTGTIFVTFTAYQNNVVADTLSLTCNLNQPLQQVTCS